MTATQASSDCRQQGGEDSGYANGNGSNAFTWTVNATSNYFADIIGRYRIRTFMVTIQSKSSKSPSALFRHLWRWSGFVNAVTRSGSNAFHGSAFYYNRNSATGANTLSTNCRLSPAARCFATIRSGMGGRLCAIACSSS